MTRHEIAPVKALTPAEGEPMACLDGPLVAAVNLYLHAHDEDNILSDVSRIFFAGGMSSWLELRAPGGPQFLFRTEDGILSFDADGEGAGGAVTIATLTGVHALSIGDFQLLA